MKILAFGTPELIMFAVLLAAIVVVIVLLIRMIKKRGGSKKAYERLTQLDDLKNRGVITESEYQQRRKDAMKNL